jgi:short-subunit dehydrogenase
MMGRPALRAADLRDMVVLVTGASSGIGRVTARDFARRGAVVMAVARRAERLERLVEECRAESPRSAFLAGDLSRREFAERVVAETAARHGRLDVLVNNAAMTKHKHVYHMSADEAAAVMNANFMSCVWTTFSAIPLMLRAGGGVIVNVSSFAARVVPPRETIYAASKAALAAFTEGLWSDLHGSGIHVGLVTPGAIDTEIWEKLEEPPAFRGAKAPPEQVCEAILEVIARRRREVTVPRRRLDLAAARFLRRAFPGLLLRGMRRMDPVPEEVLEGARLRARRGLPLGTRAEGEGDPL